MTPGVYNGRTARRGSGGAARGYAHCAPGWRKIMTMQIEPMERAAIARLVIDELREEPQLWLPADLLRLPQDVAGLTQDVAALTQTVAGLTQDVAALTQTVNALAQTVGGLTQTVGTLVPTVGTLVQTVDTLVPTVGTLVQTVDTLVPTVGTLVQTVDTLAQAVAKLEEGQQAIIAEQRAHGARLDALEEGQQVIIAEQRAHGARLDALEEGQQVIIAEQRAMANEQRDMATRLKRVEDDLGTVKGWGLEVLCARRPGIIANALNMVRFQTIDPGAVAAMADDASNNGTITPAEHDQLILADVIYHGLRRSDRTPFYTLLEASYVVDINDVNRAAERADILERITGQSAIRAVAGDHITMGAQTATATATPGGVAGGDGVVYIHVENGARLRS